MDSEKYDNKTKYMKKTEQILKYHIHIFHFPPCECFFLWSSLDQPAETLSEMKTVNAT